MSPNFLLLSIHHKYASMIFEGAKRVELRRVRPRHLNNGDFLLVYVTSPKQALVGLIEVEKVVEMVPEELWKFVKDKAGITYTEFNKYYENSATGFAIFLKEPSKFNKPIKLEQLRKNWSNFQPPQCYKYLKDGEVSIIESMTHHKVLLVSEKPKYHQTELLLEK
ncbi:MAG: ASCH domain-containing protein [Symploca sp. SIO2E6]|nr:ASCH domain-containing protein [Symploca sp. SIO2E6]